ncbi:MAG TPA: arylesterase [Gammaproteobacteria bacterium]|nr:arylesterase [Gammaproteobacteria bacterium]
MVSNIAKFLLVLVLVVPAAQSAARQTILVVGDSLSAAHGIPAEAGWVSLLSKRLEQQGYDYRVVNASISGDTTSGGLARLPAALDRYQPAIVVLELGGNDGLRGQPVSTMRSNLHRMIELSQQAGARVLLVGVRMPPNYGPVYARQFHQVYRQLADKMDVALVPKILAGIAAHPDLMQADRIHPVAAAEPKVLDNIWPVLEPLLRKSS